MREQIKDIGRLEHMLTAIENNRRVYKRRFS